MKSSSLRGKFLTILMFVAFTSPIILYWAYCQLINPSPNFDGIDPEYEYFLNSLAVFKNQPYAYVDHPGTPVEMIGSAILASTYPWLASRSDGFIRYHLENPQVFLQLAYYFLAAIHLVCMLIFFRFALRSGQVNNAVFGAALATLYFAIQPYAFSGSMLWSHNSFSFPFGTLLLVWLYHSLIQDEAGVGIPIQVWIGLGLAVGILAAITIFLASWAVGVVTALSLYYALGKISGRRTVLALAAFSLASLAGFTLGVLPVIGKMGSFWNWIYSILTHQSSYLAVPQDQPALDRISTNVMNLFQLLPALSVAMVVTMALAALAFGIWRQQIREHPALWALVGGLSVQILALTLVFLDRPLRAYYFLGVAAVVPILAMVVLKLYERVPSAHRILGGALTLAVLIGLMINSLQAINVRRAEAQTIEASEQLVRQTVLERASEKGRAPASMMILWMYGAYSPCWGLWFADQRAGNAFDEEITRICPNQYELTGRVLLPEGKVPLENTMWDIIFTCSRYEDDVLAREPGATVREYPSIEWACGTMTVILNK